MADYQTLEEFAQQYADAWGSHDPAQVASFYAPGGTISIKRWPRDDDFALGAAAFGVSEGLRGLVERVRPVDDGTEASCSR